MVQSGRPTVQIVRPTRQPSTPHRPRTSVRVIQDRGASNRGEPMRLEPRLLLGIADEMAGLTGEREPEAALAVFAAHAALEAFVNEIGTQEIASFNLRAR